MKLNRDSLQRMFGSTGGSGGGSASMSSSQIAAMFAGIATEGWVRENFLSIEFFGRLFKAYTPAETQGDPDVEVEPNDLETTITNIKAMFGFWTEQYIAALGQGSGGGGGAMSLADLVDVLLSNPSQCQTLVYDGNGHWVNGNATAGTVTSVGMTVPTGFSVNPAAITSSGIFAITFANGYSLPTTAKQSNWDTAYTNNHTHSNKAALDTITAAKITLWDRVAGATWWGQNLPANGTINGDMSNVGNISFNASGKNIGSLLYFDTANSRLGVGGSPGSFKFDVNGKSHFSDDIHIGGSAGASPYIYWGDGEYVYIGESSDDHLTIYASSGTHIMGGNVSIGNTSPSYKLDVTGAIHSTTGVLSDGYVTALSDIRLKKVIGRFSLKPEAIAYASIIQFTWKEGDTKTKHVGGIAQEWQEILPDAVIEDEGGRLAMDYGAISYVSVVSLARRVVAQDKTIREQQKTINELKAANDKLEKRLARLERLFAITEDEEGEE